MENEKKLTEVEKAEQRQALYNQFIETIENRQPFAEELTKYADWSKQHLYQHIAETQRYYTEFGPFFYKQKQAVESQWINEAFERLKEIQHKKLFELQCLWHAEQIALPEIEVSEDFMLYGHDILNCPLIDPITEEDVDLYTQYVQSNNFEFQLGLFHDWQDYDEIKEAYVAEDGDRNVPEWYDFHNGRTGKGILFTLPDIRGEKEMFYRRLVAAEEEKQKQEKLALNNEINEDAATNKPTVNKPHLWSHDKSILDFFVNTFEDKETQKIYKKYRIMSEPISKREYDYNDMCDLLAQNNELWPIKAHYDWREAFNNCYTSYQKHKIVQALPLAYEQYKMYREMSIPFEEPNESRVELYQSLVAFVKKEILQGRKLNGEPENFEF